MPRRAFASLAIVFALIASAAAFAAYSCVPTPQVRPPVVTTSTVVPTATVPTTSTMPPSRPTTPSAPSSLESIAKLPNTQKGWGLGLNTSHKTPGVPSTAKAILAKHDGFYHVAGSGMTVYLTMDQGYENGYTAAILDTLQADGVKAVFFCTGTYIQDNPSLVKRMVAEGHIVANHTWNHPNMVTKATDFDAYRKELESVEAEYRSLTGADLPTLVRMPSGNWSERCLAYNDYLGYRTCFWSFAYRDWETANQPDPAEALATILANTHPGEILLLHAVSKTNRDILHDVITGVRAQGYAFALLQ
jgi:peptidoglycan-N-acetylmuramic acid deacetylase